MSAFTEPLAQVRRGIAEPHRANNRHEYQAALAALAQVERLATDMETALRGALGYIGIDWDESWPEEPSFVTAGRAVLSAREWPRT